MVTTNFVSVSRACKNQNLSVKKVINYLTAKSIIPNIKHNQEFKINTPITIIATGTTLKIIEEQFMSYLEDDDAVYDLSFNDETTDVLDMIGDTSTRFRRIKEEIAGEKVCFIDAEFKAGNYHEIGYEIVLDGVVVEKEYFLESKHFKKMLKQDKMNRYDRLNNHNIQYKIMHRKHINRFLKKRLQECKYIVAHNAYGERNILSKNGLHFNKSKYICTSKLSNGFVLSPSPSLMEIVEHYKLTYDSYFTHYAFEDARMARKVFFKLIEDSERLKV